jgi:hypothetical protein
VLGTGKLDLKRLKDMALEYVNNKPGLIDRALDAVKNLFKHGDK